MEEQRTYTGWKAGLLVVFAVIVAFSLMNLVGNALRDDTPRRPPKVVTSVTPSG